MDTLGCPSDGCVFAAVPPGVAGAAPLPQWRALAVAVLHRFARLVVRVPGGTGSTTPGAVAADLLAQWLAVFGGVHATVGRAAGSVSTLAPDVVRDAAIQAQAALPRLLDSPDALLRGDAEDVAAVRAGHALPCLAAVLAFLVDWVGAACAVAGLASGAAPASALAAAAFLDVTKAQPRSFAAAMLRRGAGVAPAAMAGAVLPSTNGLSVCVVEAVGPDTLPSQPAYGAHVAGLAAVGHVTDRGDDALVQFGGGGEAEVWAPVRGGLPVAAYEALARAETAAVAVAGTACWAVLNRLRDARQAPLETVALVAAVNATARAAGPHTSVPLRVSGMFPLMDATAVGVAAAAAAAALARSTKPAAATAERAGSTPPAARSRSHGREPLTRPREPTQSPVRVAPPAGSWRQQLVPLRKHSDGGCALLVMRPPAGAEAARFDAAVAVLDRFFSTTHVVRQGQDAYIAAGAVLAFQLQKKERAYALRQLPGTAPVPGSMTTLTGNPAQRLLLVLSREDLLFAALTSSGTRDALARLWSRRIQVPGLPVDDAEASELVALAAAFRPGETTNMAGVRAWRADAIVMLVVHASDGIAAAALGVLRAALADAGLWEVRQRLVHGQLRDGGRTLAATTALSAGGASAQDMQVTPLDPPELLPVARRLSEAAFAAQGFVLSTVELGMACCVPQTPQCRQVEALDEAASACALPGLNMKIAEGLAAADREEILRRCQRYRVKLDAMHSSAVAAAASMVSQAASALGSRLTLAPRG